MSGTIFSTGLTAFTPGRAATAVASAEVSGSAMPLKATW